MRGIIFQKMGKKDLDCQKNDKIIHILEPIIDSVGHYSDTMPSEQIICHRVSNAEYSAEVYFMPRKKISRRRSKLMEMVLAGFTIALENLLYIRKLENAATMDPLTRCYNRRALSEYLERDIAFARRHGGELSIIMLDIDDFKRINDMYGHQTGDDVLKEISSVVSSMVRKSDYLARYGGEEFVLVLPQTAQKHAVHLAEKIRKKIAGHRIESAGRPLSITSSFGVACYRNGQDSFTLVQKADEMLYRAKASGKNVVMPGVHVHHAARRMKSPDVLSQSAGANFPPELVPRLSQG
jgi:diguanylate cyclase (GGDEF)-like protein